MPNTIDIATHDGPFHADDALAAAALKLVYRRLGITVRIIRSRTPAVYRKADIVFDVGHGEYDHHQPGGNGQRANGVPLASFGLIWLAYAPQLGLSAWVIARVDALLVQAVDYRDVLGAVKVEGKPTFDLGDLIRAMNPTWLESTADADAAFHEAVELGCMVLRRVIAQAEAEEAARSAVDAAAAQARSGVMVLDQGMPWPLWVEAHPHIKVVVSPADGGWKVETVRGRSRVPLAWRDLVAPALCEATGVADARYSRAFVVGCSSLDGALQVAAGFEEVAA